MGTEYHLLCVPCVCFCRVSLHIFSVCVGVLGVVVVGMRGVRVMGV